MPGVESETGAGIPEAAGEQADAAAETVAADHTAASGHGGDPGQPRAKGQAPPVRLLLGLGIAAVVVLGLLSLLHSSSSSAAPVPFQDLGQAISNSTGLRGSLSARWQNKAVEYQLKIEPIFPYADPTFSFVAAHPPGPLVLHVKLVDTTGYALCGKDVLFPTDSSSPGEADRKPGQDLLQTQRDDTGKVVSLSTQGTLPCTSHQYRQADHWDFSTNFPTLGQQDALVKQAAQLKARQEAQQRHARRREMLSHSGFYLQGDDQAADYDASRNVLETQLSRSFLVSGSRQRATANQWASSGALFSYKCDQHSRCLLIRSGGGQSLAATELK